jgi:hypothetical protein
MASRAVRHWLKRGAAPTNERQFRRRSVFDPYAAYVLQRWQDGIHEAKQLYEEIQAQGFSGTVRIVQRFVQALRDDPEKIPFAPARAGSHLPVKSSPRMSPLTLPLVSRVLITSVPWVPLASTVQVPLARLHAWSCWSMALVSSPLPLISFRLFMSVSQSVAPAMGIASCTHCDEDFLTGLSIKRKCHDSVTSSVIDPGPQCSGADRCQGRSHSEEVVPAIEQALSEGLPPILLIHLY